MKKSIILVLSALIIAVLVVGCARPAPVEGSGLGNTIADTDVSDISGDVETIEDIDEELDLGELDTLDQDLENII